jgi:SAM-dependent methyltransferase
LARLYGEDAELYDIAFDWDLGPEVDWLLERFGPDCHSVLEPGCGSGRMLVALAGCGLDVAGIDVSPEKVELARRRAPDAFVAVGDMVEFDLGRTFDGAVCPINTLMHLEPDELSRHFAAVARHLAAEGRYLVQVGIIDPAVEHKPSEWVAERGETKLRASWISEETDPATGRLRERSRIEVLSGSRAGEIVEDEHLMTAWTWDAWDAAIAASPFELTAVYDGNQKERPRVERGAFSGLLWHELVTV